MLIFDSNSNPTIIDSIFAPVVTDHFWALDCVTMDFILTPLITLEQTICPSLQLRILGFEFIMPAAWNILVYDEETSQLDVVSASEAAGREFTSLVYGPTQTRVDPGIISVTNYLMEYTNVNPTLSKHQMLCHPIGPESWVCITPSDIYNKYLKDQTVGGLING